MPRFPTLMHTALDALDCRELAEFYRAFLGLRYRPGDEPPDGGRVDDAGWLVLVDESGRAVVRACRSRWAPVLRLGVRWVIEAVRGSSSATVNHHEYVCSLDASIGRFLDGAPSHFKGRSAIR